MAKAYSIDFREKIIEAYMNKEGSIRQLAARFKVTKSFLQNSIKRYQQEGTILPKISRRGFPSKLTAHQELIKKMLEDNSDATLAELCELLKKQTGVSISVSNICRFLKKHQLTRKKNPYTLQKLKVKKIKIKE